VETAKWFRAEVEVPKRDTGRRVRDFRGTLMGPSVAVLKISPPPKRGVPREDLERVSGLSRHDRRYANTRPRLIHGAPLFLLGA
jgi:hypothetical protein